MNELTGRELLSESAIERNVALLLEVDPEVAHFEEQPKAVSYRDDAGKCHRHIFDFRAFLHDGTRVAIAVKDRSRVETSGIRQTLKLIEAQGTRFAERFICRTQDDAPRSRVANASSSCSAARSATTTTSRPSPITSADSAAPSGSSTCWRPRASASAAS